MKTRLRFLGLCAVLLAACGGANSDAPPELYELRGKVVELRPNERIAIIDHEEIKGWMEAMQMGFPVPDPAEYAKLTEGAEIRAVVVAQPFEFYLKDIEVLSAPAAEEAEADGQP